MVNVSLKKSALSIIGITLAAFAVSGCFHDAVSLTVNNFTEEVVDLRIIIVNPSGEALNETYAVESRQVLPLFNNLNKDLGIEAGHYEFIVWVESDPTYDRRGNQTTIEVSTWSDPKSVSVGIFRHDVQFRLRV